MEAFVCDCCHKLVQKIIEVDAKPREMERGWATGGLAGWSSANIEGQYCQECTNEIGRAIERVIDKHRINRLEGKR